MNEPTVHDTPDAAAERRPPPYLRQVRRSEKPASQPTLAFHENRIAAVVIWCLACMTTWQFLVALGLDRWAAIPSAILAQALFTILERPWWGRGRDTVAGMAVLADTLINAGGVWPWMSRLDQTPPWQMLADALQLAPGLAIVPALVLCLTFGYVLAAAPERLFKR